jgi:hypothetical protein
MAISQHEDRHRGVGRAFQGLMLSNPMSASELRHLEFL